MFSICTSRAGKYEKARQVSELHAIPTRSARIRNGALVRIEGQRGVHLKLGAHVEGQRRPTFDRRELYGHKLPRAEGLDKLLKRTMFSNGTLFMVMNLFMNEAHKCANVKHVYRQMRA